MTTLAIASHSTALPGDVPPEWVHLIPAGTFSGKDGRGPYVLKDAPAVVAAFGAEGRPLPIDFDHQLLTKFANGTTAPASGWIVAVEARADGIWGRVDWTERGAHAVVAREYRFLSPVFRFDQTTGEVKRLLHAGLVNDPNLELTAVASVDHGRESQRMDFEEFLKRLRTAFGLGADATADAVVSHAQGVQASVAAQSAQLKSLAGLLKLPDTADGAAIATAVQSMAGAAGGDPDPAKYVPIATFAAVSADLAAANAKLAGTGAEVAVNSAMTEGKVTPAMKEWATGFASRDPNGFKAWADKAPVLVPPGVAVHSHAAGPPPAGAGAKGPTATEAEIARQMGLDPAKLVEA